jgi:fatty acid desaturase
VDNTFTRASIGFIVLTAGLSVMSLVALRALDSYAGAPWWAMLLVVLVALVAEISIYSTTLHEPIHDWIREPKRRAEREESEARIAAARTR